MEDIESMESSDTTAIALISERAADRRTASEIIGAGRDLIVHFDLSRADFKAYVKNRYGIAHITALKWICVVRRFIDKAELIQNIPGPAIVQLGIVKITEEDAMLLIDAMNAGRIQATAATITKFEHYFSHEVLDIQEEVRAYVRGECLFPTKEALSAMKAKWDKETAEIEAKLRKQ
jgi:hypothetical protein